MIVMALRIEGNQRNKLDEEQAVAICEANTTVHFAVQHSQLMTERGILRLKSAPRLEQRRQRRQSSATIVVEVKRFFHQINTDDVFGTHKVRCESRSRGRRTPTSEP
jgi:hypothetical protein